jgi:hypothetical protein
MKLIGKAAGFANDWPNLLGLGIARAQVKIGMANLAYNFTRLAWLSTRTASS